MRTTMTIAAAMLLAATAAPAAAPADPTYVIYRVTRDAAGEEVRRVRVETFTEREAPAQTLGGRLLALSNETPDAEYVAEPS